MSDVPSAISGAAVGTGLRRAVRASCRGCIVSGIILRPVPTPHKDAPPQDELYAPIEWREAARVRGHPLRARRGDRPDHDQPARGAGTRSGRRRWPSCATPSPAPATTSRSARSSSPAPASEAFCSGGDQRIRGDDGYIGDDEVAQQGVGRLDVGDLHVQIRRAAEAGARRRSPATRSAAARSCTSSATSRSPPTTPSSARPGRGSAASTAASAPACWRAAVGRPQGEGDLVPVPPLRRRGGARDGARQRGRAARPSSSARRSPGAGR